MSWRTLMLVSRQAIKAPIGGAGGELPSCGWESPPGVWGYPPDILSPPLQQERGLGGEVYASGEGCTQCTGI